MAEYVQSTVNLFRLTNENQSDKNFVTSTLSSTDRFLQYDANDDLAGGGAVSGGAIYYGGIAVFEIEYPASAVGTSVALIRNNSLGLTLVQEAGGGTVVVNVAGLATDPVTTTNVCDGTRRIIAGGVGGDGVNQFAQIWVDGVAEGVESGAYASWPNSLPAYAPTNEQNVISYGFVPLTEPVTSQDELTALIQSYL